MMAQRSPVGTLTPATGEHALRSAVIDPVGQYAYFGTYTGRW
jgi:hypothetical protein